MIRLKWQKTAPDIIESWVKIATITNPETTSTQAPNLTKDKTYNYRMTAYGDNISSAESNQVSIYISDDDALRLYVDDTATGAGTGLTREDAIPSLDAAIAQASLVSSGVKVKLIVLSGTYPLALRPTLGANMTIVGESRENVIITGAGIYNQGGVITYCTFSNCLTVNGGGGILNNQGTVTYCTFSSCSAGGAGGGILNYGGTVTDCTFSDCSAIYGGAVYNDWMFVDGKVKDCSISYSSAKDGGGIYNFGIVMGCSISYCTAERHGGGIYNKWVVTDCSISNCSAYSGGGVYRAMDVETDCTYLNNICWDPHTSGWVLCDYRGY